MDQPREPALFLQGLICFASSLPNTESWIPAWLLDTFLDQDIQQRKDTFKMVGSRYFDTISQYVPGELTGYGPPRGVCLGGEERDILWERKSSERRKKGSEWGKKEVEHVGLGRGRMEIWTVHVLGCLSGCK